MMDWIGVIAATLATHLCVFRGEILDFNLAGDV